ncbi:hypothetical protein OUZ56_005767 [Daphnia magna]|uniref:Uncharacterized protein n=1 Tax=Daphnia magna TaxID=35525 RepID=A0ABQ9YTR3_9CRUS|nr:hypothetical protein OUZ56_005767 [Daphnia magna]
MAWGNKKIPVAEDWEYAFSTEKNEKRKTTKQESAEKQQRVTFASTPAAVEFTVTGTATRHPQNRKKNIPTRRPCLFCKDKHPTNTCEVAIEKKLDQVRKKKRRWKSLGQNHQRTSNCDKCGTGHHTAICNQTARAETLTAKVAASPMLKAADEAPLSIEARLFGGVFVETASVIVEGLNG